MIKEVKFVNPQEDGSIEIVGVEDGKSYGFLYPSAFTYCMLADENGVLPSVIEHSHSL